VVVAVLCVSSSRLSEGSSPERDPSAWARSWARQCDCVVVSGIWNGLCLLGLDYCVKCMR